MLWWAGLKPILFKQPYSNLLSFGHLLRWYSEHRSNGVVTLTMIVIFLNHNISIYTIFECMYIVHRQPKSSLKVSVVTIMSFCPPYKYPSILQGRIWKYNVITHWQYSYHMYLQYVSVMMCYTVRKCKTLLNYLVII